MGFIKRIRYNDFFLRENVCACVFVSVHMCIYVCICIPVCLYVGGYIWGYVGGYMHMCGCQRTSLGVIPRNTIYFFDIVSLPGLKLIN